MGGTEAGPGELLCTDGDGRQHGQSGSIGARKKRIKLVLASNQGRGRGSRKGAFPRASRKRYFESTAIYLATLVQSDKGDTTYIRLIRKLGHTCMVGYEV